MLNMIAVLLTFQLVGEILVVALRLPVPGPVAGMAMLFLVLAVRGEVPEELSQLTKGLLENLSFLFVPAGVGVMSHAGLLERHWLPLTAALVVSAVLTFAVTGWVMQLFARRSDRVLEGES